METAEKPASQPAVFNIEYGGKTFRIIRPFADFEDYLTVEEVIEEKPPVERHPAIKPPVRARQATYEEKIVATGEQIKSIINGLEDVEIPPVKILACLKNMGVLEEIIPQKKE